VSDYDARHFTGTTKVGKGKAEQMRLQTIAVNLKGQCRRDVVWQQFVSDTDNGD